MSFFSFETSLMVAESPIFDVFGRLSIDPNSPDRTSGTASIQLHGLTDEVINSDVFVEYFSNGTMTDIEVSKINKCLTFKNIRHGCHIFTSDTF